VCLVLARHDCFFPSVPHLFLSSPSVLVQVCLIVFVQTICFCPVHLFLSSPGVPHLLRQKWAVVKELLVASRPAEPFLNQVSVHEECAYILYVLRKDKSLHRSEPARAQTLFFLMHACIKKTRSSGQNSQEAGRSCKYDLNDFRKRARPPFLCCCATCVILWAAFPSVLLCYFLCCCATCCCAVVLLPVLLCCCAVVLLATCCAGALLA